MDSATIKQMARSLAIPETGVCSAERDGLFAMFAEKRKAAFSFTEFETEEIEKKVNPALLLDNAKSVIVSIFPYYRSDLSSANISCYAQTPDYHRVVRQYLDALAICIRKQVPDAVLLPVCDTSPVMDRMLAYRAGLGFFGKNNLLIHPRYGSYFFIGALITDLPLEPDVPLTETCLDCGACIASCPGRALSENFGFDCERCVSYITQKKSVTEEQKAILQGQSSVYGCDVCQRVCPHNQALPDTTVAAFYEVTLHGLSKETLVQLSNRGFKKEYQQYPFSWCSKDTLLKNFKEE